MKERQKRMLRFLLVNKKVIHIEELAEVFSIGKRTVSRDLDAIEHWFSLRGAKLERKPGQGIHVQTFGRSEDEFLESINLPQSYIESLPSETRQKLILLYLLYNNREIKISDMANSFFISDTSVWNDLNLLEKKLKRKTLKIDRLKGVGIHLHGEESQIRLEFLKNITEIFPSKGIIPYLYSLSQDSQNSLEINQLKFFIERLGFPANNGHVLGAMADLSKKLGYQFTMSGEALLYFYLQLTIHRIKSGCLIEQAYPDNKINILAEESLEQLVGRFFSGKLPVGEMSFLGILIHSMEIGSFPSDQNFLGPEVNSEIREFTTDFIAGLGKIDKRLYYFNDSIEALLLLAISALVIRLRYGIPFWYGEWSSAPKDLVNEAEKKQQLANLFKAHFNLEAQDKDLEYLLMYFQSLVFYENETPSHKIRCMICCFEGIGLASYLQTILKREIKGIEIVETTAVFKISQEYLDSKNIELLITTFPIGGLKSPLIFITLPLDKERLVKKVSQTLIELKNPAVKEIKLANSDQWEEYKLPFEHIMKFIKKFALFSLSFTEDIKGIIDQLSSQLVPSGKDSKALALSFQKRETLGSLFFDDYGIRVLHCKSESIKKPRAGVLDFGKNGPPRMVFMVAPDPCPDYIRKILSTITVSIIDNTNFRNALMSGDLNVIRKNLLDIYKNLI